MSFASYLTNTLFSSFDNKRDAGLTLPDSLEYFKDISYGDCGKENLLDVYRPKDASLPLKTIISVHGGGYVYGNKELYSFYCASLAERGFAVVNINYRLAPRSKFPAPLEDLNNVFTWVSENGGDYGIDKNNLFIVGDSAGAQIAEQYSVIFTNSVYAALFGMTVPTDVKLRAVSLASGMYGSDACLTKSLLGIKRDYFTANPKKRFGEQVEVDKYRTSAFPPAFIFTAPNDFLFKNAAPFSEKLNSLGVENELRLFGDKNDKNIGHVFHLNMRLKEGAIANDAQCAFFNKHVIKTND